MLESDFWFNSNEAKGEINALHEVIMDGENDNEQQTDNLQEILRYTLQ